MNVYLKRLALIAAIALIAIGVRLSDNGLCTFFRQGEYSYFSVDDEMTLVGKVPFFNRRGAYERIDVDGSYYDAKAIIRKMYAVVIAEEEVDGIKILYAFCPRISNEVELNGDRVNIMIAINGDKMTVGSPLIKGSY